jgi:hypothetical protein
MQNSRRYLLSLATIFLLTATLALSGSLAFAEPKPAKDVLEGAPEKSDYPNSDAVIMLNKRVVNVKKNATKSFTVFNRVKVFNKEGRQKFGEVTIPYIAGSGQPELNHIRTITPEGKVIKPDKDAIRDVTPAKLQDYPMYSDVKNKVISMPGLTNGAIIDYSYTLTPERSFLKDDFSSSWLFRSKQPVINSHYQVSYPTDMDVQWTSFGADLSPLVEEEEGRKTLTWKQSNLPKITQQPGMPPVRRISDRILVTSIESWEYYASEFWKLAKGRAAVNSAIRKKAKELTKGLTTEQEKIQAIYNYVATKIRYVAIELGRGKVQPHKASEVFRNKYGDCKDKATLMVSMLDVVGIEAHPVLILSGLNAKTDFEEPPPAKGMNHAIVAVETDKGLDLMDPTCDVCPYDYLPDSDRGKKALAIVPEDGEVKKIVKTDRFDPADSQVNVSQKVTIDEKGNTETSIEISHTGYNSYSLKSFLESYSKVRRKQIYRGVLSQLESGARLENFSVSNLEDVDKRLKLKLSYKKDGLADSLGNSLVFQTPPTLRIPLDRNFDKSVSLTVKERKYPVQLVPATFTQKTEISVAKGSEVVLPDGVSVENKWASYESSYEKSDGTIKLTRKFTKKASEVPVEGYGAFQKLVNKMSKDRSNKFQVK